jgi:Tfp pilus assembly protein PilF
VPKPAQTTLAAVQHPTTSSTPDAKRDAVTKPIVNGKPDQARPDVTRNLQIARAMLQKDNLTAAESHLSAALATQPKNQEALDMRTDLTGREQQRDAALDVARGCVYMERWNCAWHNAGSALVIDSGSAEAKSLIAQAMNEAQPPVKSPPASSQIIQSHEPPDHHCMHVASARWFKPGGRRR